MVVSCHVCGDSSLTQELAQGWRVVAASPNGTFRSLALPAGFQGDLEPLPGFKIATVCGPHHALILFERYLDHASFDRQPSTEPDDATQSVDGFNPDEHYIRQSL